MTAGDWPTLQSACKGWIGGVVNDFYAQSLGSGPPLGQRAASTFSGQAAPWPARHRGAEAAAHGGRPTARPSTRNGCS